MMKELGLKTAIATAAALFSLSAQATPLNSLFGELELVLKVRDAGTTGYEASGPSTTACTGGPYSAPGNGSVPGQLSAGVTACNGAAGIVQAPNSQPGEDSWGAFEMQSIASVNDNTISWGKGEGGEYLYGVFYGLFDHQVVIGGDLSNTIRSTAGGIKIYRTANAVNFIGANGPNQRIGADNYQGFGTDVWLELEFAQGCGLDNAGQVSTYCAAFQAATLTGSGRGYLNVVGGTAQSVYDTNGYTTLNGDVADLELNLEFTGDGAQLWTVAGSGTATGLAVPEPGSLALVGLAMLGLGAVRRSKATK